MVLTQDGMPGTMDIEKVLPHERTDIVQNLRFGKVVTYSLGE